MAKPIEDRYSNLVLAAFTLYPSDTTLHAVRVILNRDWSDLLKLLDIRVGYRFKSDCLRVADSWQNLVQDTNPQFKIFQLHLA